MSAVAHPARVPGYSLATLPRFRRDPLGTLTGARRDLGEVVRFSFGPVELYLISHPTDVERVLVDNHGGYDKKAVGYGKLRLALGDGLLTSDGDTWRRQRRLVQPAFHRDEISRVAAVVTDCTQDFSSRWEPGRALDVHAEMTALTLDIICRAMFSTDVAAEASVLGELMTTSVRWINKRMMSLTSIFDFPDHLPFPENRRFHQAIATGDVLVEKLIEERRVSGTKGDLLSMLMDVRDAETGEGLSSRELRDALITIFAAGHETTANSLAWIWHLLADHPADEARLHAELDAVLDDRVPDLADVRRLPWTTAIVKEALRLFPPAWILSRRAVDDDVLGGHRIPAGSGVLLSPYVTQRHPALWHEPDAFRPERFLSGSRPRRYAWFPFGGGPRLCVGKELAMMELVLVVARVGQRFRLVRKDDARVEPEALVTLRPRGALTMVPQPRR